jgi:hypothetical protein
METLQLLVTQLGSPLDRREPCLPKDLVRVCVADPGEDPGIGQGPLQRAVLGSECRGELVGSRREGLDAATIETAHSVPVLGHPDSGPLVGPLLGEDQ